MKTTQAELFAQALLGEPERGAMFSDCRRYRYLLWEYWDKAKPIALFLMLNPSTADEVKNDPTVERCSRRARKWGYGGFRIANIFALRSTDPKALYSDPSPISEPVKPTGMMPSFPSYSENDRTIIAACSVSKIVICGWGEHGKFMGRGADVMSNIRDHGFKPYALRVTKSGQPGHPLYIPYTAQPFEVLHA